MNKIRRYCSDRRILLFVSVLAIGSIVFWSVAFLTDWESTKTSLFRWDHWFFMDWFGELHRIQTGVYTGDDIANYPAFCFMIFRVFYAFLPKPEGKVYDDFSIREIQQAVIPFAIFMILFIFGFYHIIRYYMREKTSFEREAVAVSLLLMSSPFVYMFERGNMIIIALFFTYMYIILYDSEKKCFRIISYICLAIAAAIKLYPAVFGILTFLKRRYKETFFLILIGALAFFLPFVFFGGLEGCMAFFSAIFGSFDTYYEYGFGYDFSIYNLERLVISLCAGYAVKATNISIVIVLLLLIITFLCVREYWQKLVVLALFIILIPKFSYFYTIGFLVIPLLYLFQSNEKKIHYLYIIEFLVIFFPWIHIPLERVNFMLGEEFSHTMGLGHIMVYIGILSLLVTLLIDGISQRMFLRKIR